MQQGNRKELISQDGYINISLKLKKIYWLANIGDEMKEVVIDFDNVVSVMEHKQKGVLAI